MSRDSASEPLPNILSCNSAGRSARRLRCPSIRHLLSVSMGNRLQATTSAAPPAAKPAHFRSASPQNAFGVLVCARLNAQPVFAT